MDLKAYIEEYRSSDTYNPKADRIITNVGLILPIPLTIYGLCIYFNLIPSVQGPINLAHFLAVMVVWTAVSLHQKLRPGQTPFSSTLRLIEFHIVTALYLLLVSGVLSPMAIFLPMLLVASYLYFNKTGFKYSALFHTVIVLVDAFLIHGGAISFLLNNFMVLATIIITSLALLLINKTNEVKKQKIFESLVQESLQREQVATIINNLTDAVMSVDKTGTVKICNSASLSLIDTNKPIVGNSLDSLVTLMSDQDKPTTVVSILSQCQKTIQRDDLYFLTKNDNRIRLLATFAPIRNHHLSEKASRTIADNYIVIFKDITQAKNLEEERDEFVSVISHELRTPVTITEGTISNIQILLDKRNLDKNILKNSLQMAHDQVLFLASMINDISSLSRVEHGTSTNADEIVVEDLIKKLFNKYSYEAEKKDLKLKIKLDKNLGMIKTNSLYLEELLQNFITNAIKYTMEGSVTLIGSKDGNLVSLKIQDTGIGISKDDQAKIFQKFYRSEDTRARQMSGTGLGLYVSGKLARKIGATLHIESELNKGSTFEIRLPGVKDKTKKGKT